MRFILLFITLFLFAFGCSKKAQKEDSSVQRVISLAPSITEMVYAIGAEQKLAAVTDYCAWPPQAKEKESVGGLVNPNLEKITALRPDLILATHSYRGLENRFPDKSFRIVYLPESTMESVFVSLDSLGVLLGRKAAADSVVRSIKQEMAALRNDVTQEERVSAMLVLGRDGSELRRISVIGPGAYIDQLWRWVGGRNAFDDLPATFAQVNREDILYRNPQAIIEFTGEEQDAQMVVQGWQPLAQRLDAVNDEHVFVLQGNHHLIPGPRMAQIAGAFKQIVESVREKQADEKTSQTD